jgi:hypothetical protein
LGAIDTAAGRTVNLIEELLDAVHIRAGRGLELRREPVDLVAMARAVAAEHGRASTQHAIQIESGPDRLVGVWDGSRLERVLANLIGNAIKFSPAGGEVVLRIRREDRADGAWAVLLVDDRGVGIPAADLPRVFDRFHRGANAAGAFAGTGDRPRRRQADRRATRRRCDRPERRGRRQHLHRAAAAGRRGGVACGEKSPSQTPERSHRPLAVPSAGIIPSPAIVPTATRDVLAERSFSWRHSAPWRAGALRSG